MMIKEFSAFLTLFRQGKELTNAGVWKHRAVAANLLVSVLGAVLLIAKGAGYGIEVDDETLQTLAGGIAAAVCLGNSIMHVISSSKAGLPARRDDPDQQPPTDSAG